MTETCVLGHSLAKRSENVYYIGARKRCRACARLNGLRRKRAEQMTTPQQRRGFGVDGPHRPMMWKDQH